MPERNYDFRFSRGGIVIVKAGAIDLTEWDHHFGSLAWRFYWNPRPGGRVRLGEQSVALGPGNGVLIPPGPIVDADLLPDAELPLRHLYFHFRLAIGMPLFPVRLVPVPVRGAIRRQLEAFSRPESLPRRQFEDMFAALRLLTQVLQGLPRETWMFDSRDARVGKALQTIEQRYDEPLGVADLARQAALTPESLIRLFKRELGISPYRYLKAVRLQKAKDMLAETEAPIDHVAEACGFGDRGAFSRAFHQLFHQTPAAYRKHEWHLRGPNG